MVFLLTTFHLEKIHIDVFVNNADMSGGILPRIGIHSGASAHAGANVNVALENWILNTILSLILSNLIPNMIVILILNM